MTNKNQTLGEFIIENQKSHQYSSGELSSLINSIRLAAKVVNFQVNKAGLVDIIGDSNTINTQGEEQQKLDFYANDIFINALRNRNYAEDNVDRLKRIADGKATDNMLAIKISPRNRNTRSFQKRQNNRKAAAQSERPKGWLWGGTRRMRKMTRRR